MSLPERFDDALDLWDLDDEVPPECEEGRHTDERMVFNGGNPWFICAYCGTKLRDAAYSRVRKEWF